MRQRKVWRYYCDFCKKANCSSYAITKHEKHCCHNPDRICRMCKNANLKQQPLSHLINAYNEGGIKQIKDLTKGCPACMLAGLIGWRKQYPESEVDSNKMYPAWSFKDECITFWTDLQKKDELAEWYSNQCMAYAGNL